MECQVKLNTLNVHKKSGIWYFLIFITHLGSWDALLVSKLYNLCNLNIYHSYGTNGVIVYLYRQMLCFKLNNKQVTAYSS